MPHSLLPEDLPQETRHAGVLVGLSGGLDSGVLLHALSCVPAIRETGLRALHVHHGLQPEADAWTAHCARDCERLGIPLTVVRVAVDSAHGDGPEGAARRARHAAFDAALRDGEVLALAHHRDDQAETFLLRALRASGPDGLAAMQAWRRFGPGWLWRPLLATPRSALLEYAHAHGLAWVEDPSNSDLALDRNFIRQRVLPLLRERWPHAGDAFASAAALQAEAAALLDDEDARALADVRTIDPACLSATRLLRHPPTRRARVLRCWIDALAMPRLPAQGVARIESDLLHAAPDADAEFAWAGHVVQRWRDLLHAGVAQAALADALDIEWDGAAPLPLPTGDRLVFVADADDASGDEAARDSGQAIAAAFGPLRVHARRGGERITLPGRSHSHALKHVLQDLGVPPWERRRMPLLSDRDGRLLAAADLAYSATFDAWLRSERLRLAWERVDAAPDAD